MRKQKGITLIALVITIIVLLILAAVSITALTDEDKGVVTKAKTAAQKTEDAADEEDADIQEILDYADSEDWGDTTPTTPTPTTCTVTFSYKNSSGTNVTSTVTVNYGESVPNSSIPSPETYSNGTYTYTFSKWVTTSDGSTTATLTNITENKTVYAYYIQSVDESLCFVAGTEVLTENGLVNIEDIESGMLVYSYNEETKEVELKEVLKTFKTENVKKDMVKVTVNGEIIESTSKHQYYVVDKGWTFAFELEKGDRLLDSDGKEKIVENVELMIFEGELKTVYNMEVQDNHNYFVGEENILVHNAYGQGTTAIVC